MRKNALQILIPKYGLECTLYLSQKEDKSVFEYNEDDQTQKAGDVVFHAFDPVTVRLSLDSKNIQHEKFVLQLVKPHVEGFSVAPLEKKLSPEKKPLPEKKLSSEKKPSPEKKRKRN